MRTWIYIMSCRKYHGPRQRTHTGEIPGKVEMAMDRSQKILEGDIKPSWKLEETAIALSGGLTDVMSARQFQAGLVG